MEFRLSCGHTRRIHDRENFMRVIRDGCMRCHLEAKAADKAAAFFGDESHATVEVVPAVRS